MKNTNVTLAEGETLLEALLKSGSQVAHDCARRLTPGARLACQVKGPAELLVAIPGADVLPPALAAPISVTAAAATHLESQLAKHPGAMAVRLSVDRAGCSGLRYRVDPAHAASDEDAVRASAAVRQPQCAPELRLRRKLRRIEAHAHT